MPRKKKDAAAADAASDETPTDDLTPASDDTNSELIDHDGKQGRMPGMERKGNKAIEKAMEQVRDLRSQSSNINVVQTATTFASSQRRSSIV